MVQNDIHELVVPSKHARHTPARIELDCRQRVLSGNIICISTRYSATNPIPPPPCHVATAHSRLAGQLPARRTDCKLTEHAPRQQDTKTPFCIQCARRPLEFPPFTRLATLPAVRGFPRALHAASLR